MEVKVKKTDLDSNHSYYIPLLNEDIKLIDKRGIIKELIFDRNIVRTILSCDCKNLEKITFNNSLKELAGKFNEDIKVNELDFPESLEYIGYNIFKNCKSLEKIILNSIPKIKETSFENSNIREITINSNNKNLNIKIDKKYKFYKLYSDGDLFIECGNKFKKIKIMIDKDLNKYEINNDKLIDNVKCIDFSNCRYKNICFNLDSSSENIDTIILPNINNEYLINIKLENNIKIRKIIIKSNNTKTDDFEFSLKELYNISNIIRINKYYVFHLSEKEVKHSIILDENNNVKYVYNKIIDNENMLNEALFMSNIDSIIDKYNISKSDLEKLLLVLNNTFYNDELPENKLKISKNIIRGR